jgi:hypothetical protein
MSQWQKTSTALFVLLVLSNAFWAYYWQHHSARVASSQDDAGQRLAEVYDEALLPMMAAIAASADPRATQSSIVAAARGANRHSNQFCMDGPGVVRVRNVGLRFDAGGRLTGATTSMCVP